MYKKHRKEIHRLKESRFFILIVWQSWRRSTRESLT